ncbi:MAG: fimbrial biogenesis outer membrane usher protein [Betaproteobacteria bacterium]|nr:fimbrial biogenesis outer membrane usher protein [Betaproteobacteria bacterium]
MRTGALFSASVDYSPRDFRFGISQTGASRNFRQLGSLQSLMQIKRVTTANVGISIKNSIGLGLALVEQVPYDNPKTQIATLSGSLRITNKLNASATLSKTRSQDSFGVSNDDTAAFINFLYTFDERHSASADAQRNGGRSTGALNISRQLAAGDSWGYRAFVDSEREIRLNGLLQNRFGNFSLQANRSATKENSYALEASGAIAVAGWTAAPARKIDSSFAMVVMPGFPGVKVYSNAQAETYTDSRGVAVVAGLTPYAENNIRIDPRELPLDTKISRSSSKIVPAAKAGVRVDLGVKRSQAATFRVVFEDGQAAPAGAAIYRLDRDEMLPVGYDGLVYMEDLATRNTFELRWKGQRCTLTIDYQSGNDPLPDLGDVLCKGVKR